jgi:hypothetical protein
VVHVGLVISSKSVLGDGQLEAGSAVENIAYDNRYRHHIWGALRLFRTGISIPTKTTSASVFPFLSYFHVTFARISAQHTNKCIGIRSLYALSVLRALCVLNISYLTLLQSRK